VLLHARRALPLASLALAALWQPGTATAAGGAYAVDDSEIGTPGDCKVESWGSFADNSDRIFAIAPACSVSLGRPVELGMAFARARDAGVWGSSLTFKGKTNIVPLEPNKIGLGFAAGVTHDTTNGVTNGVFVLVPVSFQLTEQFRLNVNGGWLWDPSTDAHAATWGAGFEWNLVKPLTLIGEVFGVAGGGANRDPRAQVGLRYTPMESFDIDVIYGRNIAGENANWITVGLNVRFSAK
jgi:hypothetical protein